MTDAQGAVIRGAKVTAINEATGLSAKRHDQLLRRIRDLAAARGPVYAEIRGRNFKQRAVKGVTLELNQKAKIDAALEVGQITEVVTSEDDDGAPLARTETAEAGEVIENKRIVDLPLNGRLYLQLAQLTPGVVENARGGFGQQLAGISGPRITVMGARESDNQFTLDGVGFTDRFYNTLSGPLSVDAIQEFNVRSNLYSAESGRLGGAQINIAIKSGTNELHGSVYGFLRNDEFDARNFFDVTKPEFRQSQFGGTVGGPVIKDKALLLRQLRRVASGQVPDAHVLGADRRVCEAASSRRSFVIRKSASPAPTTSAAVSPTTPSPTRAFPRWRKALLQFVPLPNLPGAANNFIDSPQEINDGDQFTIKTNYRLSANDEGFVRYTFYDVDAYQPYGFVAFASSPISLPGIRPLSAAAFTERGDQRDAHLQARRSSANSNSGSTGPPADRCSRTTTVDFAHAVQHRRAPAAI